MISSETSRSRTEAQGPTVAPILCCLSLAMMTTIVLAPNTLAQGFGWRSSDVPITRALPPDVYLPGASFSVDVISDQSTSSKTLSAARDEIKDRLSAALPGMTPVPTGGDIVFTCRIADIQGFLRRQPRWGQPCADGEDQNDGCVQPYGPPGAYPPAGPPAGPGPWDESETTVSYVITDRVTTTILDSGRLGSARFDPATYPDFNESGSQLGAWIGDQMAARVGYKLDRVAIPLPKGQLKTISTLFTNGLWDKALSQAASMPRLAKAKDDAYRSYMIGVLQEWLGYFSSDPSRAKGLLDQAVASYQAADRANPKEVVFGQALSRAQDAANQYKEAIDRASTVDRTRPKSSSAPKSVPPSEEHSASRGRASNTEPKVRVIGRLYYGLTDQVIADWVRSAVPAAEVITRIKNSRQDYFELTPSARYSLRRAGADDEIIQAMERQMEPRLFGPGAVWPVAWATAAQIIPFVLW